MRRGQRTFRPDNKEDRHKQLVICVICGGMMCFSVFIVELLLLLRNKCFWLIQNVKWVGLCLL